MYGLNRHKGLIPIFLTEAVVNLALSIWLVQTLGIVGVAWGTVLPRLGVALVALPWYLRRVLSIALPTFWINAWIRPMISMIPFAVATYIIQRMWPATGLVIFFSQVASVLPVAAIGAWFFCLTHSERQRCGTYLAQRVGRGRSRA
jgi:Na+-driven multidrug efflux pump